MRIVAGRFGGRRLVAPKGTATRPTADRVREALFSILFDVEGLRVLDLYAGTGAVGLEALSRGARSAIFVENARGAVAAIEKNLAALAVDRREAELFVMRADRALERLENERRELDLIFADPPYAEAEAALPAILVKAERVLSAAGTIVLEHASATDPPPAPPGLVLRRTKRYGETALAFYSRPSDDAAGDVG